MDRDNYINNGISDNGGVNATGRDVGGDSTHPYAMAWVHRASETVESQNVILPKASPDRSNGVFS